MPEMPPKKWIGTQNSEFVAKRHADLASVIEEILNKPWQTDENIIDFILASNVEYRIKGRKVLEKDLNVIFVNRFRPENTSRFV